MNDSELERIAARLGHRAAARLNVDHAADAVVARLKARRARWWASPALLRIAAAIAITVGAGVFAYRTTARLRQIELASPVLLQSLSRNELEEVLDSLSLEPPAFDDAPLGLHALNDEQLRELLHKMEG
jgi:hypothetical protein